MGLVGPQRLLELAKLAADNKLSSTNAKQIFLYLFDEDSKGKTPERIAQEQNLLQVSDEGAIAAIVDEVLAEPASAKAIADIQSGNDKAIGYLVGQIMKQSKGQANPGLAQKLIRERLG
jgi:aspartyl-tRNA(Asn)/glutamyl-tRNA(Gln) amidotransferase subunit B